MREQRRTTRERFTQDTDVRILVATDAAGECLNLQREPDGQLRLPWNPNKIEQRFGRIHRIGQTEVCHLWNLVAANTREGGVFLRLLDKIEQQRQAYKGKVFDVLGDAFENNPLRNTRRETGRYQVSHVPGAIRDRDRIIGMSVPVLAEYERVTFQREKIKVPGATPADLIAPSHPLLDSVVDLTIERHHDNLKSGAVLVDPNDPGEMPGEPGVTHARETAFVERRAVEAVLAAERALGRARRRWRTTTPAGDIRSVAPDGWS